MDKLVAIVSRVPAQLRNDDDVVDRFHHRYTTLILVVFAVLVTMQQYVGKPMVCWVPKEFTGSHTKFTNSFCWVKNTYFLPFENEIPKHHEPEGRRELLYYQWMPFILLLMAVFFYLPSLVWNTFNSKAGVDSDNILASANTFSKSEKVENREKTLRLITNQIDRFLGNPRKKNPWSISIQHVLSSVFCRICGKRLGNYLILLFIVTKILYIANVFGQLFVLNDVLKTSYNLFGAEAVENAMQEKAWLNETVFPKVTMCDFHVRRLGNVQRYTVQCLLPVNLYTEKMFIFLWFWMVMLLVISFLSLATWILRALCGQDRLRYIQGHLNCLDKLDREPDRVLSKDFTYNYLKQDGVFLLRLVGHNTNGITVMEIIGSLWDHWRVRQPIDPLPRGMEKENSLEKPTPPDKPNHLKYRPNSVGYPTKEELQKLNEMA